MDAFQLIVTTAAVIIVILLMVYFACQLGPKANAWIRSTREEKIGLSHKKLYNANGFLIRSGSDFLLSSTGSFKRFDSVDRECKQQDARFSPAPSTSSAVSPLWNLPAAANIPGQPLRPAPSPPPPSATTPKLQFFATHSLERDPQQPKHHHPIKQQSWAGRSASPSPTIVTTSTAAIPRPTAKRQFSTPASIKLPELCSSPIKLRSADQLPVVVQHSKSQLSREISTNPFLSEQEEEEDLSSVVVVTEATNPSRLPDLVSDSLVVERRHPPAAAAVSDSAKQFSSNPFCDSDEEELPDSQWTSEQTNAGFVNDQQPLIFNFDNLVGVGGTASATGASACECEAAATGSEMNPSASGDLISLDVNSGGEEEEEWGKREDMNPGSSSSEGCDENVINALREAEGSIRKLELASRQDGREITGGEDDEEDDNCSVAVNRLAAKNFLLSSSNIGGYDGGGGGTSEGISKYEDSFSSDSHEELLLLQYHRRFRSHSETEATLSIFDRLLSQQRRMMLSATSNNNNPFLSPDLLQHENYHLNGHPRGYSNNGSTSNISAAKSPLIRSNGMMLKQNLQLQELEERQQQVVQRSNNPVHDDEKNEPYKPILSKTVSETYLGQFMATSALPRSSSILQLLEQQHGPPSPTLPWAASSSLSRNGNSCMKSGATATRGKHHTDTGDGIPKVAVFANSCTTGGNFKRTLSSESVSSQSSVLIADLESSSPASAAASGSGLDNPSASGQTPSVTGYLCVGLQYDKNNANEEGAELIVTVLEAKELLGPPDSSPDAMEIMDTFVRIYLVPDEERAMQTKLFKNSSCPSYNETFSFWVSRKHHRRHSLWFHLYHSGQNQHTLIGEGELQIGEAKRPLTTWIALSDSRHATSAANNFGELMFSLSYLPTAERLTVVVVKGRNLQFAKLDGEGGGGDENQAIDEDTTGPGEGAVAGRMSKRNSITKSLQFTESPSIQNIDPKQPQELLDREGELSSTSSSSLCDITEQQLAKRRNSSCTTAVDSVANVLVKVYLLKDGKKVSKKKTTIKRMETCPIYNESMIFSVPPYMLGSIQIRLTVAQIVVSAEMLQPRMQIVSIGHVIVGNEATGKGLKHWNQMMTSLRKPVAMWHPLRRCLKESSAGAADGKDNGSRSTKENNRK